VICPGHGYRDLIGIEPPAVPAVTKARPNRKINPSEHAAHNGYNAALPRNRAAIIFPLEKSIS